jgi:uronate dehydrogenase
LDENTSMHHRRIAVTGAAGSLAADIIPELTRRGYEVVCTDVREPRDRFGCEWRICAIDDRPQLSRVLQGCDAVVHLAGIPLEADWETLSRINVDGTQAVLETSRTLGIKKVVLASSIHAAGFVNVPQPGDPRVADDVPVRPNTFYGVSKAAAEALGSMYADRYGMDVICLRIASRYKKPENERMLSTWLSPRDAVELFDAALSDRASGFRIVWGVSHNSRGYLSPDGGSEIGFHPADDAEDHAAEIADRSTENASVGASEWDRRFIGGVFSSPSPPLFVFPAAEG